MDQKSATRPKGRPAVRPWRWLGKPVQTRAAKIAVDIATLACLAVIFSGLLPGNTSTGKLIFALCFLLLPGFLFWFFAAPWKPYAVALLFFAGMLLSVGIPLVVVLLIPGDWPPSAGAIALGVVVIWFFLNQFLWRRYVQFPFENKIRFRSLQNDTPLPDDWPYEGNSFRWRFPKRRKRTK